MNPKPVNHTRTPGYPTRREVLAGAASFVLVGLSGRGFTFAEGSGSGATIVAPIFEHGEGRGAIGCQMVVPPAFLSEEEGMQILGEELAKHGIELKPGLAIEGVSVPARIVKNEIVDQGDGRTEMVTTTKDRDVSTTVKLDAVDPEKNVAVEFITREDVESITKEDQADPEGIILLEKSIHTFEFKDTAERVAAAAKREGPPGVFLGVFYEPVIVPRPTDILAKAEAGDHEPLMEWEAQHRGNMDECKQLLRYQAQDFAAWLKRQKVIK